MAGEGEKEYTAEDLGGIFQGAVPGNDVYGMFIQKQTNKQSERMKFEQIIIFFLSFLVEVSFTCFFCLFVAVVNIIFSFLSFLVEVTHFLSSPFFFVFVCLFYLLVCLSVSLSLSLSLSASLSLHSFCLPPPSPHLFPLRTARAPLLEFLLMSCFTSRYVFLFPAFP